MTGAWGRRLVHFAVGKGQEAVLHGWKSNRIGYVSHAQWTPTVGLDPDAFRSVLKDEGGAGLIVGDGSMHTLAVTLVVVAVASQNPVHRRCRDGPRVDLGALQNLHIVQRLDMKEDAGLLHFVIEAAGLDAGYLYFGIEKVLDAGWVIAVDSDVDMPSVHEDAQFREPLRRCMIFEGREVQG
jgi:hypothetical protein